MALRYHQDYQKRAFVITGYTCRLHFPTNIILDIITKFIQYSLLPSLDAPPRPPTQPQPPQVLHWFSVLALPSRSCQMVLVLVMYDIFSDRQVPFPRIEVCHGHSSDPNIGYVFSRAGHVTHATRGTTATRFRYPSFDESSRADGNQLCRDGGGREHSMHNRQSTAATPPPPTPKVFGICALRDGSALHIVLVEAVGMVGWLAYLFRCRQE